MVSGLPASLRTFSAGLPQPAATRFLPITLPFHSHRWLGEVPARVAAALRQRGIADDHLETSGVGGAVVSSCVDGGPLAAGENWLEHLLTSLAARPVFWTDTVRSICASSGEGGVEFVDFGPGGGCHLEALTQRVLDDSPPGAGFARYFVTAFELGQSWLDWTAAACAASTEGPGQAGRRAKGSSKTAKRGEAQRRFTARALVVAVSVALPRLIRLSDTSVLGRRMRSFRRSRGGLARS